MPLHESLASDRYWTGQGNALASAGSESNVLLTPDVLDADVAHKALDRIDEAYSLIEKKRGAVAASSVHVLRHPGEDDCLLKVVVDRRARFNGSVDLSDLDLGLVESDVFNDVAQLMVASLLYGGKDSRTTVAAEVPGEVSAIVSRSVYYLQPVNVLRNVLVGMGSSDLGRKGEPSRNPVMFAAGARVGRVATGDIDCGWKNSMISSAQLIAPAGVRRTRKIS